MAKFDWKENPYILNKLNHLEPNDNDMLLFSMYYIFRNVSYIGHYRFDVSMEKANGMNGFYGFEDLFSQAECCAHGKGAARLTSPEICQVSALRTIIKCKWIPRTLITPMVTKIACDEDLLYNECCAVPTWICFRLQFTVFVYVALHELMSYI